MSTTQTAEINNANVELVKSEPTRRRYGVSLAGERLRVVEDKWFELAQNNARLPGFRKGRLTREVILDQLGDWIKSKIADEVLRGVVEGIVRKDQLKLVSNAVVDKVDYKLNDKFSFEVVFEVEPVFSVKNYAGIELKRYDRQVKDEDVEKELNRLLGSQEPLYLEPVNPPFTSWENVWVLATVKYYESGSAEPLWAAERSLAAYEEEALPAGFREAVASMKPGESKEVPMSWDEDCPVEALRGKKGKMAVEILEFKRGKRINADVAAGVEESKLAEARTQVKNALQARLDQRGRKLMQDQLVAALLETNEVEVSDAEVENRTSELIERARGILSMSGHGLSPEHEAELKVKYRIEAANDVRFSYIAREIAKRENLTATEEDIKKHLESMTEEDRQHWSKHREALVYDIVIEKVFDLLIAKAKIEKVEV